MVEKKSKVKGQQSKGKTKIIKLPLTREDVLSLNVGDRVLLRWSSGDRERREFPQFPCAAPVLLPGRLVPAIVAALTRSRRVGVVVPVRGQAAAAEAKWAADGFDAVVTWASPVRPEEMDAAARMVSAPALELVVLECMGHDEEYRLAFARRCGRQVVLAQSLVARVAGEFVAGGA